MISSLSDSSARRAVCRCCYSEKRKGKLDVLFHFIKKIEADRCFSCFGQLLFPCKCSLCCIQLPSFYVIAYCSGPFFLSVLTFHFHSFYIDIRIGKNSNRRNPWICLRTITRGKDTRTSIAYRHVIRNLFYDLRYSYIFGKREDTVDRLCTIVQRDG